MNALLKDLAHAIIKLLCIILLRHSKKYRGEEALINRMNDVKYIIDDVFQYINIHPDWPTEPFNKNEQLIISNKEEIKTYTLEDISMMLGRKLHM